MVLAMAPAALAPVAALGPAKATPSGAPHPMRVPTLRNPGMIFPWFGRSELRPLISRRLKLVLEYRPIAYC